MFIVICKNWHGFWNYEINLGLSRTDGSFQNENQRLRVIAFHCLGFEVRII